MATCHSSKDAEVLVEALLGGQEFRLVSQVPFAKAGGSVSLFFENLSNGDLLGI